MRPAEEFAIEIFGLLKFELLRFDCIIIMKDYIQKLGDSETLFSNYSLIELKFLHINGKVQIFIIKYRKI